jgi:hypothetical protein
MPYIMTFLVHAGMGFKSKGHLPNLEAREKFGNHVRLTRDDLPKNMKIGKKHPGHVFCVSTCLFFVSGAVKEVLVPYVGEDVEFIPFEFDMSEVVDQLNTMPKHFFYMQPLRHVVASVGSYLRVSSAIVEQEKLTMWVDPPSHNLYVNDRIAAIFRLIDRVNLTQCEIA